MVPLVRIGRPRLDFDRAETIEDVVAEIAPSLIVNAAAYTQVDAAEANVAAAWAANATGPARLADCAAERQIPLIHISTDYVFDGLKGAPYVEADPVSPQGVYAKSKLAGERAVLERAAEAIVLRTSWVYAETGHNFVRTMLNVAKTRDHLRVVSDQKGCPTAAADLARAILSISERLSASVRGDGDARLFHAAGTGWTTWYDLAVAIFAAAAELGRVPPRIEAISTAEWPTPARRPPDSRLDCSLLEARFGVRLPDWHASLRRTVMAIVEAERATAGSGSVQNA
jgi:dTDP-4-dehydrorhamnose reductase